MTCSLASPPPRRNSWPADRPAASHCSRAACPTAPPVSAGRVKVRIIERQIIIATTAGTRTGTYRLATTLLDHRRYPALELVTLYDERWQIESAYFEIKKTTLGRCVLRACTLPGITEEIYALLTVYQALRIAIADTTLTAPGTDPDRASFTHRPPGRPPAGHPGHRRNRHRNHRSRRHYRPPHPGQPAARPTAAHQPPGRQAPTVPLRLKLPVAGTPTRPPSASTSYQRPRTRRRPGRISDRPSTRLAKLAVADCPIGRVCGSAARVILRPISARELRAPRYAQLRADPCFLVE